MLLSEIRTFMSLTQAPSTLRSVDVARFMPSLMASSKLFGFVALISVTRATLMGPPSLPRQILPYRHSNIPDNADNKRAAARSCLELGLEHGVGSWLRRTPFRLDGDRYDVGPV